ncbi:MAG: EVE domain-containing protein [Chitinophagales bacterium]|nr:EVE domain-containing protein [Chitinophagales bacterium]OJV27551.1 MAG: ubiquinol-cytochrome C reductase [Bacteroidetes bacterium 37-13]HRN93289.1 EVE domain-containing protein [Chitinophagales bacterium]HRP39647.1 EVE domain-containing protein [Chitinophagales bacterium]
MAYWLIKSEPGTYPIEQMKKDKRTFWDGVRNYQARNNLRAMKKGDLCLFYHSVTNPGVVGLVEIVKEAYQDPTTNETAWVVVDVAYKETFKNVVSLESIKQNKALAEMVLVKSSRLSVQPVRQEEFEIITALARK